MYFLLLVPSFSIISLFSLFKSKNPKKTAGLPLGLKGLPLIGNLHEFDPVHPHVYFHKLAKKYGPLMRMKFGFRHAIVISSARVAKTAFKNNDLALSGRPTLIAFQRFSYNGKDIAFSSYNETWREMRKLSLIHLFSVKQVVSFLPIRKAEVSRMIKDIIKKSDSSELINLSQATFFLSVAFFFGDYFPLLGWIDKLTGMSSRLDKNCRDLDDFFQELIIDHLDQNRPESMKGDILDLMIKLKQDQASTVPIEWENIKGILMVSLSILAIHFQRLIFQNLESYLLGAIIVFDW